MKNVIILIFLFISTNIYSQPQIDWEKNYGDKKNQNAYSILQTKDYGFAIVGGNNAVLFDKMWLLLTDNEGNLTKQTEVKGTFLSRQTGAITDFNNNILVLGVQNSGGESSTDISLVKLPYNFSSNQIFNVNVQGNVFPTSIVQTKDEGFIIAANIQKADMNYDIAAYKLDKSYKLVNQFRYNTDSSSWVNKVIETKEGFIVYVGMTNQNGRNMSDIYVICTDKFGRKIWEQMLGGSANDEGVDVIETSDGLLVLGTTYSEGAGWSDIILYNLEFNGTVRWSKTYGGARNDDASRIVAGSLGIYILGSTKSIGSGGYDYFILNIDKFGNKMWEAAYGGSLDEKAIDIAETFDNGLVVVGTTESKGAGKKDIWLIKLKFSIRQQAQQYIESNLAQWQEKGKYEKLEDYQKRVNYYTREQKIFELSNDFFGRIGNPILTKDLKNAKLEYDTESEVFKISLTYFNPLYVPVKIKEAEAFENSFQKLEFKDVRYNLTSKDKLEVYQATIFNQTNSKTYFFDASKPIVFNNTTIVPDFKPVDVTPAPDNNQQVVVDGNSDVDNNIPVVNKVYNNRYALIIGNANYIKNGSDMVDIRFSINDARVFKKYASNVLGITENNILYIEDANATYMRLYIDNFVKLIEAKAAGSEFYIYYSGHGSQNEKQEAFLVPVGVKSDYLEQFGIKLSELYSQIKPGTDKKVYVFLDACFSGGGKTGQLLVNAKTGVYRPSKLDAISPNVVVFAASSEKQISQEFIPMQHGLFTYFLLKNIKESKGNITYGQLFSKIYDELTSTALNPKNNLNNQTPQINTNTATKDVWKNWKMNQ